MPKDVFTLPQTPWGPAQTGTEYAPGITFYSTAGHGGFCLSNARADELRLTFPGFQTFTRSAQWFEEDCDACAVILLWSELFEPQVVNGCLSMVQRYPDPREGRNYFSALRPWLESPPGLAMRERCARWRADNAHKWEESGLSSTDRGWHVMFRRVGDRALREAELADYPRAGLWSDEEIAAATLPPPPPKPVQVDRAPARRLAPFEPDYSGALGADGMVYSDADPGL